MSAATLTEVRIAGTHPYAEKFPLLPADELAELVESIAANGLRAPIVLTPDGLILDGRNRYAACERLGIEPETVVYEGSDLAEYVIDCNVTRRNQSTGARAMSTALVLAAAGRREGGRWDGAKGRSIIRGSSSTNSESAWVKAVTQAGTVLDYAPDLATQVAAGEITLNAAYQQADEVRRSAEAEDLARKARERQAREEAKAEEERAAKLRAFLTAEESKYLPLVDDGTMTPAAAWAAHQEDTAKQRRKQAETERGWRDTCTTIAECVRFLDGGSPAAALFLEGFYPHEAKFLADGMQLTRSRIQAAIDYLTTLLDGVVKP